MFQGLLGMLTVTWKVKPVIVTSHLVFGLLTVSLLWWLWLALREREPGTPWTARPAAGSGGPLVMRPQGQFVRGMATLGLVALIVQILLGGWTSTNYAAVACPDLPTCQGAWWPEANFRDAFVLWRGLGVNYEGGVLDLAARVAIHFTHRLGAVAATLALLLAALATLRWPPGPGEPGGGLGSTCRTGAAAHDRDIHGPAQAFRSASPPPTTPARRCCCLRCCSSTGRCAGHNIARQVPFISEQFNSNPFIR